MSGGEREQHRRKLAARAIDQPSFDSRVDVAVFIWERDNSHVVAHHAYAVGRRVQVDHAVTPVHQDASAIRDCGRRALYELTHTLALDPGSTRGDKRLSLALDAPPR